MSAKHMSHIYYLLYIKHNGLINCYRINLWMPGQYVPCCRSWISVQCRWLTLQSKRQSLSFSCTQVQQLMRVLSLQLVPFAILNSPNGANLFSLALRQCQVAHSLRLNDSFTVMLLEESSTQEVKGKHWLQQLLISGSACAWIAINVIDCSTWCKFENDFNERKKN